MKSAFQQLAMSLTDAFGDIFTTATLYKKNTATFRGDTPQVYAITKIMIEDSDSGKGKKIFGEKFKPEYKYALVPALSIDNGSTEMQDGDEIRRSINESTERYTVQHHKVDAAGAAYELLLSVEAL